MAKVTINIEATMEERWVNDFCSMLMWMQSCGNIGHSSLVGFYTDGDGDFRPEFNIDREFEYKKGIPKEELISITKENYDKYSYIPERLYDAG